MRSTFQRALCAVCLAFAGILPAHAATEFVTVEATGRGVDRQAAVYSALTEAIGRVEGIEISAERSRSSSSRQIVVKKSDGQEQQVIFDQSSSEAINTATDGIVDTYDVIRTRDIDNLIEVTIEADIATFKAPGPRRDETRRRMAIYPVQASGTFNFLDRRYNASAVANRLTQQLTEAMTGTRRFAILERERTEAIEAELEFLDSPDAARGEAVRIGEAVGADYLMNAQIVGLNIATERNKSQLTGEVNTEWRGGIAVEVRIVSTATRQIVWADGETLEGSALPRVGVNEQDGAAGLTQALSVIADRITARAVDAIYPMRIVSISPAGELAINQGNSRLSAGDRLRVFKLGERMKDPYSGESLGRKETQVGTIEVIRSTSKVSYAEPVRTADWTDGSDASATDFIVRRGSRLPASTNEKAEAPPVLLPQDR